jgi:hypothetical protein
VHPAQHRGLRELYAGARQLTSHWSTLRSRLRGDTDTAAELDAGISCARELLDELAELTAGYDLFGGLAAQGVGARLANVRNGVGDRFLERNQALRLAVLDVQHLTTLVGYLGALAEHEDDAPQAAFCARWERRLKQVERSVHRAAVDAGHDPESAIAPADGSPAGRLAHGVASAVGTAGEWIDRGASRVPGLHG